MRANIWKVSLQGNAILKQKWHANPFDLEQICAHISLKKNIYQRAYVPSILLFINIQGYSKHSSYHIYIEKNSYMHAQGIVPKLHMSIFKVFGYQKLPTHI